MNRLSPAERSAWREAVGGVFPGRLFVPVILLGGCIFFGVESRVFGFGQQEPIPKETTISRNRGMSVKRPAVANEKMRAALDRLNPLVGEWRVEGLWGLEPGLGLLPQEGTWTTSWVLGGRFLRHEYFARVKLSSAPPDRVKEVWYQGLYTYDPDLRKYTGNWVSSQGSTWEESGNFDDEGRLVMTGRLSPAGQRDGFDDYQSVYISVAGRGEMAARGQSSDETSSGAAASSGSAASGGASTAPRVRVIDSSRSAPTAPWGEFWRVDLSPREAEADH